MPYGPLGSSLDLILPSALMKEGNCGKQQKNLKIHTAV